MSDISKRPRRVALFVTCLGDLFYPQAGVDTVRLLERVGLVVDFPEGQTCCGQPAFNSGFQMVTRQFTEHFLDVFQDAECIVTPFGSCAALVKNEYPQLFRDDPIKRKRIERIAAHTFELTRFLVNVMGVEDFGAKFHARVTYHDGCHTLRGLGIREEPRRLLSHVEGLELVEMEPPPSCCGFGGTFAVRMPEVSGGMLDEKVKRIQATKADYVVSTEFGCMMNIGGGLTRRRMPQRMIHIATVLAGGANGTSLV